MEAEITEVTHDEYFFHLHIVRDGGHRVGLVGTVVEVTMQCGMSQLSLLQMHCSPCSFILNKLKTINHDKSEIVNLF